MDLEGIMSSEIKPNRERWIWHGITYMWNLQRWGGVRLTGTESRNLAAEAGAQWDQGDGGSAPEPWPTGTPWTAACQAPLSTAFPRQEQGSGLPFPFPGDLPDTEWIRVFLFSRQILLPLMTWEARGTRKRLVKGYEFSTIKWIRSENLMCNTANIVDNIVL